MPSIDDLRRIAEVEFTEFVLNDRWQDMLGL